MPFSIAIIGWSINPTLTSGGLFSYNFGYHKSIKNGLAVWQHISLLGEFDYSGEILKDFINFQIPKLFELKIRKKRVLAIERKYLISIKDLTKI